MAQRRPGGPNGSNRGKVEVRIDGGKVATAGLCSPTSQPRKMVFARSWGSSKSHTLEVRALGTKRAAATGKRVDLDAFVALR